MRNSLLQHSLLRNSLLRHSLLFILAKLTLAALAFAKLTRAAPAAPGSEEALVPNAPVQMSRQQLGELLSTLPLPPDLRAGIQGVAAAQEEKLRRERLDRAAKDSGGDLVMAAADGGPSAGGGPASPTAPPPASPAQPAPAGGAPAGVAAAGKAGSAGQTRKTATAGGVRGAASQAGPPPKSAPVATGGSCMAAEMPVQATGRDMLVNDLGTVPLQEILGLLESMGIPCTAQDEAAARAAYAKAHAAFGKRRCVAVARD